MWDQMGDDIASSSRAQQHDGHNESNDGRVNWNDKYDAIRGEVEANKSHEHLQHNRSHVVLFYRYFLPSEATTTSSSNAPPAPAIVSSETLHFFQTHSSHYLPLLQRYQLKLCRSSRMKGRILLSTEGINGTVSSNSKEELNEYIEKMEQFDLIGELGLPPSPISDSGLQDHYYLSETKTMGLPEEVECTVPKSGEGRLFANIDWKTSVVKDSYNYRSAQHQPFPDLKIQIVKEIINTGGLVNVNDIPKCSGNEISAEEFHGILVEALANGGAVDEEEHEEDDDDEMIDEEDESKKGNGPPSKRSKLDKIDGSANNDTIDGKSCNNITNLVNGKSKPKKIKKEVVLIDVRNTFEHAIGHFLHPRLNASNDGVADDGNASLATVAGVNNSGNSKAIDSKVAPVSTVNGDGMTAISKVTISSVTAATTNNKTSTTQPATGATTNPNQTPALNPNTVTFSHFDSTFCSKYSSHLKNKKVLMYCTGGIRCVKASAMLKSRGVDDVSHLSGGIHRYLEKYGSSGFYKGKVFVFDQRVALDPDSMLLEDNGEDGDHGCTSSGSDSKCKFAGAVGKGRDKDTSQSTKMQSDDNYNGETNESNNNVVGKCIECETPYDQLSGANLCTVCRDLILICPSCQTNETTSPLWEYHCQRHQSWKHAYFTFLERYTLVELQSQHNELQTLHDSYAPPKEHKNTRRTLRKQMEKVLARIQDLKLGNATAERNAKRRCRTCFESDEICDGKCWGFWKHSHSGALRKMGNDCDGEKKVQVELILEVKVGDRVTPGPNWNELRLGSRYNSIPKNKEDINQQSQEDGGSKNTKKIGSVVEIKSWGSGGNEMDCVAVVWDEDPNDCSTICGRRGKRSKRKKDTKVTDTMKQSEIYRWGALARSGKR